MLIAFLRFKRRSGELPACLGRIFAFEFQHDAGAWADQTEGAKGPRAATSFKPSSRIILSAMLLSRPLFRRVARLPPPASVNLLDQPTAIRNC